MKKILAYGIILTPAVILSIKWGIGSNALLMVWLFSILGCFIYNEEKSRRQSRVLRPEPLEGEKR